MSRIFRSRSVTVFFPAYNDAESMQQLIPLTVETLGRLTHDFEIIVIDDGSIDQTPQVLEALRKAHPSLRIVRHARNLGYGAALQSGFRHAAKELVFYTDGDGQYDVRELEDLLALLRPEVDAVVGYKLRRADSRLRSVLGKLYCRMVKFLFRLKVQDVDCDFRLIRRKVLGSISLTCRSGAICVELMRQIEMGGFRVLETPVHHYPRAHGRSKFFHLGPMARMFKDLMRLFFSTVLLGGSHASGRRSSAVRGLTERGNGPANERASVE